LSSARSVCAATPPPATVLLSPGSSMRRRWLQRTRQQTGEHVLDHLVGAADRTPIRRIQQLGDD
jgi:hypothetical protein